MSERGIATGTVVDAKKEKIGSDDAIGLVRTHSKLVVARGKKALTFDLKNDAPADEEILTLIMGRSGNLRAPSWTRGKTMVVGFHAEAYGETLG